MTTYTDPSNFKPGNPGTGMAHILMPRHEASQGAMIAPRSGIVMRPAPNDATYGVLHYEGNLHGAMNLNKWQERVMCAAGRLFTSYPTIAKSMLPADQVKKEFEDIGHLRWFGSPNTPYLMHLDLECLDALAKMTGEEKHAHVQWALVGEKGDSLRVLATGGKKIGEYIGRVAVRATGSFNIQTRDAVVQGISHKYCRIVQRGDGYGYAWSITPFNTGKNNFPVSSRPLASRSALMSLCDSAPKGGYPPEL